MLQDDRDQPLVIPIANSSQFVEIFPEELGNTPASTLLQVLRDEQVDINVWADAALHYMRCKHTRESLAVLEEACGTVLESTANLNNSTVTDLRSSKARLLASTGIAQLATLQDDETRQLADQKFTQAQKIDTFFPMTWIGRGILNLNHGKLDQASFFFKTTLKQCGPVLPALLGMAAVMYGEKDYPAAQSKYMEAIRRYPHASGAATRVGFGLTCYQLGQVDRAKAAFQRALDMEPDNVQAMVGKAILDMAAMDPTQKDFVLRTEKAMKLVTVANLLDHQNAMVQNHLANHYFWKWTPVTGTVQVTKRSKIVKGDLPIEPGERIRIGAQFETTVEHDDDDAMQDDEKHFRIMDEWTEESATGLKVWKKDYDRVIALAKGAYNSTQVEEIKAESLFFLARVYHVRQDMENANKFYERACKLAPDLTPARFGLAQTLIAQEDYKNASKHLSQVISASATATDALALLGLLQVRTSKHLEEGLVHLRKAIELDPLNPDLVVMEALALQQHKSNYPKALDRYKKAVDLLSRKGAKVPFEIYCNSGVICHETNRYDEALDMYKLALNALDVDETVRKAVIDSTGIEGGRLRHKENNMFYDFVDTNLEVELMDADKKLWKVKNNTDPSNVTLFEHDHIQLGGEFTSEIIKIQNQDGVIILEVADAFEATEESEDEEKTLKLFVKRENQLLNIPDAIVVAFNIARLHEAAGRTIAAIEIHKAIIKRNPAYVNSYLRLACIARDCGTISKCSEWLKLAAKIGPGNPEVMVLVGNLHLSLCDWKPAQDIFDSLLMNKVANVEAYAALSLGNIYFANLHVSEKRYAKHLTYASDYYKKILSKDPSNAYAANGLGTVLAEKAEIFKAKDVFNRVREVSGDGIADTLLNLGHIYLAQKKHPEALQMYMSYMKRTEDGTTPITSKSRADDFVDILLYIAFAYFDWARHTELSNDANAAPADDRYKEAMKHLEEAISKQSRKDIVLRYNLCMVKLQAANCVLQKLTRNIPRTVEEVEEALNGLKESLEVVERIVKDKASGQKIPIGSSVLQDFVKHCRANIASAESHLDDEKKRAAEIEQEQMYRQEASEAALRSAQLQEAIKKEKEAKDQEEREKRAMARMQQVEALRHNWQEEQAAKEAAKEKKTKKRTDEPIPDMEEEPVLEEDDDRATGHGLFDDSDDEAAKGYDDSNHHAQGEDDHGAPIREKELFGDNDDHAVDNDDDHEEKKKSNPPVASNELFGDSDESDEELFASDAKRSSTAVETEEEQPSKKRRVLEDEDD